jgi:hypothetical protein
MKPIWNGPAERAWRCTYLWGGYAVESNVPLPRLPTHDRRPEIRFRWRMDPPPGLPAIQHRFPLSFRDGSSSALAVGADAARLRYQVDEVGSFVIAARSGRVDLYAEPEADPMRVEHFLVNAVLATFAGLRSVVCLHAAATSCRGEAIVFAGPSGVGKSTAAWSVVSEGGELLSDDVAILRPSGGRWLVYPTAPTIRLAGLKVPGAWDNRGKAEVLLESPGLPVPVTEIRLLVGAATLKGGAPSRPAVHRSLLGLQAGWPWAPMEVRRDLERMIWDIAAKVPVRMETWGAAGVPAGRSVGGRRVRSAGE